MATSPLYCTKIGRMNKRKRMYLVDYDYVVGAKQSVTSNLAQEDTLGESSFRSISREKYFINTTYKVSRIPLS